MKFLALLLKNLAKVLREPLGLVGFSLALLLVLSAIFAGSLSTHDPIGLDVMNRLQGPSAEHWLGTDQLGRDLYTRVLYGGQVALQVALIAVGAALVIGLGLGMLAGFGPPWLDHALMLLFDTLRSFPTVMFALAIVTLLGPSLGTVILVVVITSIPTYGRLARTQTQSLKHAEFILAERAMGASMGRILLVHILPNVVGPLLILASMDIPVVITIEAGLSFLGLGVKPPTPSWGSILNDGYSFIRNSPWPLIAGGLPLILSTLAFTFLGETLRDVFDPRISRNR